ncbi:M23 family metallopeptidase [Bacillus litorisediminis]|uniref:M23 family metallopeptidase n=1 Tax=Bacillus litorisediminis TaxID=2922713 RepID=UPI001FAF3293|nr:M23 family metallopeptidase [Bacillus litorisediminis]
MKDYIKRLLIVALMAFFISLLFLGGTTNAASEVDKDVWLWPADGVISDEFGTRNGHHYGIDIAGEWNSNVHAVYEGRVVKSYYSYSYGHVIFIEHPNGYETVYAHLHKRLKDVGEWVKSGELIGTMGTTGGSSGVHLHFEVHISDWNFAKSNVINPEAIYGQIHIGQEKTFQSRWLYVQNILHHQKEEKLAKDGLWKNLEDSESVKEWLDTKMEPFAAERVQSVRNIPINTGVFLTEYDNPISSTIDFSGIFLLAGLHRRRKANFESMTLLVSQVKCKLVYIILPNPERQVMAVYPKRLAYHSIINQKLLFLLARYKARIRLWQFGFESSKRYILFHIKQCEMKFQALKCRIIPFRSWEDKMLEFRVIINGT